MFLTVALPIYNAGSYLEDCIESILAQSMNDYEILLVDDGSTDDSPQISDRYAQQYPALVRVIHNRNQGSLLTRRCCLENARGDFIHIIDADDKLIDRDAYRKVRTALEENSADMAYFLCTRSEETREIYKPVPFADGQVFEKDEKKRLERLFVSGTEMNALWNKVFSRELIDTEADYGRFSHVVNGTDVFQMLPIFTKAQKIVFIREVFYYYRITEGSIVRRFSPKVYPSIKENSLLLERYLGIWGIDQEPEVLAKFRVKRLSGCTTAAKKVAFCEKGQKATALEYLASIAEDRYFLDAYEHAVGELGWERRLVAFLLKHRAYHILWYGIRTAQR